MLGATSPFRRRVLAHLCTLAILPTFLFLLYAYHVESLHLPAASTRSAVEWRDRLADAARRAPLSFSGFRPPLQSQSTGARRCGMCDVNPELCEREGADKLIRSVTFQGTNQRLRRALRKMRKGGPWVMGVIGGSGAFCLCVRPRFEGYNTRAAVWLTYSQHRARFAI